MLRLIIFDVDGTLAEKFRLNLLPGVADFFRWINADGCRPRPALAIATNQGGVGMRYWLENGKQGNPRGYPTARSVEARMHRLADLLGVPDLRIYTSFRYQDRDGTWSPVPPGEEADPRWRSDWRKPAPGMLLQAVRDAGVEPTAALFVGDSGDDRAAAQAVGIRFLPAADFFARPWSDCRDLENLEIQ